MKLRGQGVPQGPPYAIMNRGESRIKSHLAPAPVGWLSVAGEAADPWAVW